MNIGLKTERDKEMVMKLCDSFRVRQLFEKWLGLHLLMISLTSSNVAIIRNMWHTKISHTIENLPYYNNINTNTKHVKEEWKIINKQQM